MSEFEGRAVIVTGGASGIGAATARAFAQQGASVLIADVDGVAGEQLAHELGQKCRSEVCDVSDPLACEKMVERCMAEFGRLDIAFNNAGIVGAQAGISGHELSVESWRQVIDISLSGVFYSVRAELPIMLAAGGGVIINTSSILGIRSMPGVPAYVAAKHGLIGLTMAIATEYGDRNIRCSAVAPGFVATPGMAKSSAMTPALRLQLEGSIPAGRFAEPDEVARAVLWLSSNDSSYLNGIVLPVDGGYLTR